MTSFPTLTDLISLSQDVMPTTCVLTSSWRKDPCETFKSRRLASQLSITCRPLARPGSTTLEYLCLHLPHSLAVALMVQDGCDGSTICDGIRQVGHWASKRMESLFYGSDPPSVPNPGIPPWCSEHVGVHLLSLLGSRCEALLDQVWTWGFESIYLCLPSMIMSLF